MIHKYITVIFAIFQLSACICADIQLIQNISSTYDQKPFYIILGYEKQKAVNIILNLWKNGFHTGYLNNIMDNIPFVKPLQKTVLILNINSENSVLILDKANEENLFNFPLKWLIINNDNKLNLKQILNIFSKFNILVDSEILLASKTINNDYLLIKIYKLQKNDSNIIKENFGRFSIENGLEIFENNKITAIRRKNLSKIELKSSIVVTHNETLQHLSDYRDKHIDSITKTNYILVQHLLDIVNATVSYNIQSTWGYKNNDSTWTGMIGDLTENKADIGGTPLFVTTDRVEIIDYIAMTTATRSNFVFRQPKLSYVTNVFTLPFHWTVWISSIFLVIITTIGLYVMLKWEKYTNRNDPMWELDPRDSIIMSVGAICQQGSSHLPNKTSGMIVTLFVFISLMFLYTSYSANIVALLQSSSDSIKTLEDLLNSRLQVGVDDTVFNRFYFPSATEPTRKAIYEQKVCEKNQPPRFFPIEEGVRRLRRGLFAFHMEGGSGYKIVSETFFEDEKCDLQEISFLQVPDPWLAIQKNSSYKEMLKIGLRQIQESGLQSREVSKIYTKKPKCHGSSSSYVSVGLIDIYAALEIFIIGVVSSSILFIVEILVFKYSIRCKHI